MRALAYAVRFPERDSGAPESLFRFQVDISFSTWHDGVHVAFARTPSPVEFYLGNRRHLAERKSERSPRRMEKSEVSMDRIRTI